MSSVFQNQLLKVEKGLLVGCLEKRGRLAGGGGGEEGVEAVREEEEEVSDRSDWEREGKRRSQMKKGTGERR